MTATPGRRSPLDRLLRLFTDVRPGEGATALLLALNVFLLLTSYSMAKVLRESMILPGGGANIKAYTAAGTAGLLVLLVPAYGALAARAPRRTLIAAVSAFFFACMLAFYALARLQFRVGVPFYIWLAIFSLMIIAQFWSFANDLYTTEEGKRLFPLIQFGGSIGAVAGAALTGPLVRMLGVYEPMLLAAVLLAVATAITLLVDRNERRRTEEARRAIHTSGTLPAATAQYRAESGEFKAVAASEAYSKASGTFRVVKPGADEREEVKATKGAFRLVFSNPYLLAYAVMILLLNWVNTAGGYLLDTTRDSLTADQVASFYSGFYTAQNILSLALQMFIVSRLLKYGGVRLSLLVLPAIALVGYGAIAFVPVLAFMRWTKITENATDYSLQNTLRAVLFLPTTREEKYSAKQAIDGFFVRAGDLLHAGLLFAGTTFLAMQARHFAMVNIALVIGWLALALIIGRRYERLAAATAT
jgi:AAA family ATP:ADP antiporter